VVPRGPDADFFRWLRSEPRLVFRVPAPYQLDILSEICGRFPFVSGGKVTQYATFLSDISTCETDLAA
jgi:hypothetical protein